MNGITRHILWLAMVAGALATTLAAQQVKSTANWANLTQLDTGMEVRVTLASGATLRGFVQRVTPDSLTLNATTSQETPSRQDVRRIQIKKPSHRGRNTLIGLAIGTGAGLAGGAGADARSGPGRMFPDIGKAVFTPVGAIVGTVIEVALPTGGWREIYKNYAQSSFSPVSCARVALCIP